MAKQNQMAFYQRIMEIAATGGHLFHISLFPPFSLSLFRNLLRSILKNHCWTIASARMGT